jgi:hypothetical protein
VAPDDDIDDWCERVAGRADTLGSRDEASALAQAIRNEDAALLQGDAQHRARLERLLQRLESEGLLESRPVLRKPARGLPSWLAVAASVGVLALGVQLLLPGLLPIRDTDPTPASPVETTRGYAGVIKRAVADPEAQAAEAERDLRALGLEPRRVPTQGRVILEFDVADAQIDGFRPWAEARGGRVVSPGRYRVILESSP